MRNLTQKPASKSASFNAGSEGYAKSKSRRSSLRKSLLRAKAATFITGRGANPSMAEPVASAIVPSVAMPDTNLKRKKSTENCISGKRLKSPASAVREDEQNATAGDHTRSRKDENLPEIFDSSAAAKREFTKLIHPIKPTKFFRELWERKPLLIKRHSHRHNSDWFSVETLDKILRQERVMFGENIDIVEYNNAKRITHNPPGRAYAAVVWDYYKNGCSVRLLNPHTYSDPLWHKLALLQDYFGSSAGANVYLTPAGSQGFAPHYDDIEAFVVQVEGRKHWKLYNPRNEDEELPRFSSSDFKPDDLGSPILDTVIEAGDVLYFPRGVIHQAFTPPETHSLHVTVSFYQQNTWGDLLQKITHGGGGLFQLLPQALQLSIDNNVELRRGLPLNYLSHMGVANSDTPSHQRTAFANKLHEMVSVVMSNLPIDASCDQMGVKYLHDCLPPVLSEYEKSHSVHGSGERWDSMKQRVTVQLDFDLDTAIRLIRQSAIRLVSEDDTVRIYHSLNNTRLFHGCKEHQYIEISAELTPAVELLLQQYPNFVTIDDLPLGSVDLKNEIVTVLYDNGLIIVRGTNQQTDPSNDHEKTSL